MVAFKPLGNAQLRVFQQLLTLDNDSGGVRILMDLGWDALLASSLAEIESVIESVDLILLTHPTLAHMGSFCYLRMKSAKFRSVPCYGTLPVINMSQMATIDAYRTNGLAGSFPGKSTMSLDDIEAIFSEIRPVKYSQPLKLSGSMSSIEITAYNAGHTLGGAMWRISDGVDVVLYATDWNHARDAHLSGAFLEASTGQLIPQLAKPSLLISTCPPSLQGVERTSLKVARQSLLDSISMVLRNGGTVLLPTSSGSRVLELILVIGQFLEKEEGLKVPLIYASKTGAQTLTLASSMLEWMVSSVITDWQVQNDSPFDPNKVHHVQSAEQLANEFGNRPKVVLATGECLESGLSKQIFATQIAGDPNSALILTEQCPPNSLGHDITRLWIQNGQKNGLAQLTAELTEVSFTKEVPLEGSERARWEAEEKRWEEEAIKAAEIDRRNQEILIEAARGEEIEEDEEEDEGDALEAAVRSGGFGALIFTDGVYDLNVTELKDTEVKMLPFIPSKRRIDDYGEALPSFLSLNSENHDAIGAKSKQSHQPSSNADSLEAKDDLPIESKRIKKRDGSVSPMKLITECVNVNLVSYVACIDVNGLTNTRSFEMIVRQVTPARLLLLPDMDHNQSEAVAKSFTKAVEDVRIGDKDTEYERSNFSLDLHLDPQLENALAWKQVWGGFKVAKVYGKVEYDGSTAVLKGSDREPEDTRPILVGDIRLTILKRILAERGVVANFSSQSLLSCSTSSVAVRRLGDDRYSLEGSLEPEYYIVRDTLKEFLASI